MVIALLLLTACAHNASSRPDAAESLRLLTRVSLDIRGTRPTDDEIDAVSNDPGQIDAMLDRFVKDGRFPDRVADLYNELYRTRTEYLPMNVMALGIVDKGPFLQIVGQEPLRLLAEVAKEDLPYTTIATADWTMINETLAQYYPVSDYPTGATGWHKVHYNDGRPAAGVMATNGLWWRYTSTASNANRGRANQVARLLLCEDYLSRDVDADPSLFLLQDDALRDAINENPACQNCHVSLDPLAGNFGGFFLSNYTSAQEALLYHPAREQVWERLSGVAPGYYGLPTDGLVDLGPLIAKDPRFATCAVRQAWTLLLRQEPTVADTDALNAIREAFLAGGLTFRSLFRAVLDVDAYRDIGADSAGETGSKVATVELLASETQDLTGFHWTWEDQEVLRSDKNGLHLIGGGVDGVSQITAPSLVTPGLVLVQRTLAELSASYAVDHESTLAPTDRRLFTEVDFTETASTNAAALRAQLVVLHRRLYGALLDPSDDAISAGLALWEALYAEDPDVSTAWKGVLTAMLRDPRMVIY